MKLKPTLTGILLFSNAAAYTGINKDNYKEKLCGPDLFVVTNPEHPPRGRHSLSGADADNFRTIEFNYAQYCTKLATYNRMLDKKEKCDSEPEDCTQKAYIQTQVDNAGIDLANTCFQLESNKKRSKHMWDDIMIKRKECIHVTPISTGPR
jgi:hypothetical protein